MKPIIIVACLLIVGFCFSEAKNKTKENSAKRDKIVDQLKTANQLTLGKYENARDRPTKCHVCRVLVQELRYEMDKTANIRRSYKVNHRIDDDKSSGSRTGIDYRTSEMRITDIMDVVCNNVLNYRSIAGPEFPYLRDVKSSARQSLEDAMRESGLSIKLDAPEELVADPSSEIRRMYQLCMAMVEEHEDDILHWYKHAQDEDPLDYICAERVLDSDLHGCLTASTDIPPDGEKVVHFSKDKKHHFQYESSHTDL